MPQSSLLRLFNVTTAILFLQARSRHLFYLCIRSPPQRRWYPFFGQILNFVFRRHTISAGSIAEARVNENRSPGPIIIKTAPSWNAFLMQFVFIFLFFVFFSLYFLLRLPQQRKRRSSMHTLRTQTL